MHILPIQPVSPFPAQLIFHSRPSSPNVLYINFVGAHLSGTDWNWEVSKDLDPGPFDLDGANATFDTKEQDGIRQVWTLVANYFSPFDIDVTTERPANFNNQTIEVLVTPINDINVSGYPWDPDDQGLAAEGAFGHIDFALYRPAFALQIFQNEDEFDA